MTRKITTVAALAACILAGGFHSAQAYSSIGSSWRNYYNVCNDLVAVDCNACHQNGFNFNPYGAALFQRIANQGMSNTEAFVDAEGVDSDGDGYTNGQEIVVDCTLPGDASDHGTVANEGSSWERIKTIFR